MPRGRKAKRWIKIDCEGILRGSINHLLKLDGQAVWVKMIALSEVCGGRSGFIEDNNHKGLPYEFIAQELHCSEEILNTVLKVMEKDRAIKINGSGSIQLINFRHYQETEYDRQKIYRKKDGEGKQTFDEYVEAIREEYSDIDVDKELKKFRLWWSEGTKELKRPKLAFRNWLENARKYNNDKKPTERGKYKHMEDKGDE